MRAIRLHEFGPADNLVLDELPDLEPGQLRIAVATAGVHLVDTAGADADLEARRALGKVVLEPAMKSVAAVGPHRQTDLEETR